MSYSRQNPESVYRSKPEPVVPLFEQASQPQRASGLGATVSAIPGGYGEAGTCTETAGAMKHDVAQDGPSVASQTYIGVNAGDRQRRGADCQAPSVHARRSDPDTSKAAAKAARRFASHHCGIILAALKQYGPMGKTKLSVKTQISDVAVARRLADLEKMNLAKPTGDTEPSRTNRQERIWCAL